MELMDVSSYSKNSQYRKILYCYFFLSLFLSLSISPSLSYKQIDARATTRTHVRTRTHCVKFDVHVTTYSFLGRFGRCIDDIRPRLTKHLSESSGAVFLGQYIVSYSDRSTATHSSFTQHAFKNFCPETSILQRFSVLFLFLPYCPKFVQLLRIISEKSK